MLTLHEVRVPILKLFLVYIRYVYLFSYFQIIFSLSLKNLQVLQKFLQKMPVNYFATNTQQNWSNRLTKYANKLNSIFVVDSKTSNLAFSSSRPK